MKYIFSHIHMEESIIMKMSLKRNYTMSSQSDSINYQNGRCPDYAIRWGIKPNLEHWPPNHDCFKGFVNNNEMDVNETLREILSERLKSGIIDMPLVFCDLDGVLADFNKGVYDILKKNPDEISLSLMWGTIRKKPGFFENLEWTEDGKQLWDYIKKYNPIILTGCPNGGWAEQEKKNWCARELGEHIKVITCKTDDKSKYCIHNSVLIDDRDKVKIGWEGAFGKFILHDNSCSSIERLDTYMKSYE